MDRRPDDGRTAPALPGGFLSIRLVASLAVAVLQVSLSCIVVLSARLSGCLCFLRVSTRSHLRGEPASTRFGHRLMTVGESWRPRLLGVARARALLGLSCLGCRWALMLLAFADGTMHPAVMWGATAIMTADELPETGAWMTVPAVFALTAGVVRFRARAADVAFGRTE